MKTTHIDHNNVLKVQLIIVVLLFLIANCDRNEQFPLLDIDLQVLTYALDVPDGVLYIEHLSKIHRYGLQGGILRLYYSEEGYLQYRPATEDSSFREKITGLFEEIEW